MPGGHLIQQLFEFAHQAFDVVFVEVFVGFFHEGLDFRQRPFIQFVEVFDRDRILCRVVVVDLSVGDIEGVHVPQRKQFLADLIRGTVTEEQVVLGIVRGVHPAHHVHAHMVRGFVERNGIAGGFMHVLAEFVLH